MGGTRLVHFSALDYGVIGLFLAAILALGFSAKLRETSVLHFLAAGRSLSLPAFVATLVTVWYGGILGVAESVSYFGIGAWLLIGVPYYIFALIYAGFFAKKVRGAEELSIPERIELRWGKSAGLVAALLVFCLAVPAAHVLMLGTIVQSITGLNIGVASAIGAAIGVAFLYKGGLLADVRVGMLAFVAMYVGFAVIDVYCLTTHPPATILPTLRDQGLLHFSGGKGWIVVLTFFILGAWTLVDPGFHQRVASSRSPELGRRGVYISVGFWMLFDILSITAAMYAVALSSPKPGDGKLLYPVFGDQILPPGLKALFFCGMIGTILSALVGYTLVSGATIGRELIGRLKPGQSESAITLWSRAGTAIACLLALILAVNIKSVVDLWYAWGGCVIGSLLIPVCLAYLQKSEIHNRQSKIEISLSMALAFTLSVGWLIYGLQTNNMFLNVALIQSERGFEMRAEAESPTPQPGRLDVPVGTMAPALVISMLVIGAGSLVSRRKNG